MCCPAGQARSNPAELLDSTRWHQLCAVVKNTFRFVPDRNAAHRRRDRLAALQKVNATGRLTGVLVNCAENWFLYKRYGRYPYPYPEAYQSRSQSNG
jgi:hypothetical protein